MLVIITGRLPQSSRRIHWYRHIRYVVSVSALLSNSEKGTHCHIQLSEQPKQDNLAPPNLLVLE